MNDKYATALERALYNWYYGENGADPEPVFNAMSQGAENGMQCLIPIETPEELLQQLLRRNLCRTAPAFTINEELPISFQHLVVDEEGHYLIPIFTSSEQLNIGGEGSAAINQSFGELLDSLDQWPDCLGYVVNPFTNKIMVDRNIREKIRNFQPKSHVAFVQGSVLDLHVDAVVNSAHKTLLGGEEVDEVLLAEADGTWTKRCSAAADSTERSMRRQDRRSLTNVRRWAAVCKVMQRSQRRMASSTTITSSIRWDRFSRTTEKTRKCWRHATQRHWIWRRNMDAPAWRSRVFRREQTASRWAKWRRWHHFRRGMV